MVSLATYQRIDPDHLAAFSGTILRGMLRDDLGFDGVVLSDALGATAVASIPAGQRAIDYISAGGDMLVVNQTPDAVAMARALLAKADQDGAFRRRIDESALRVLRAKETLGLLPCG
jgi:beta-N-acetylhexosaminidase